MKVFNPTLWDIECGYNGREFVVKAGEEKSLYDSDVVYHLCKAKGTLGLVHLVFTDDLQKRYDSYEEFKKNQTLVGLKACRDFWDKARVNELQAQRDMLTSSKGSEMDKVGLNVKQFEEKIKKIDQMISDMTKPEVRDQDEPRTDQNEVPIKARRGRPKILDRQRA